MSNSTQLISIRGLIEGCWPGEWGIDPVADDSNCLVFRATDIDNDGHLDREGGSPRKVLPSKIGVKSLKLGDIILEASGGAPDKPVGRVALVEALPKLPALTSNFFRYIRPKDSVDPRFLLLQLVALNRSSFIWRYQQQTTGLINLKVDNYLNHKIFVPEKEHQKKIAHIIFSADHAIETTKFEFEKYQKIKLGLVHDVFTRGILPNGQLRPKQSEAPELYQESVMGWIPKEWTINPLKKIYKNPIRDFGSFSSTNLITFLEEGVPFIKSEMIKEGELDGESTEYISVKVHKLLRKSHVISGNILFSKIGSALGKAVLYKGEGGVCNSNAAVAKIEVNDSVVLPMFLESFLNSNFARQQFSLMIISLLPRINLGDIDKVKIQTPSIKEQELICNALSGINKTLSSLKSELNSLKEIKLGLMQDLLTGKVEVKLNESQDAKA